MKRKIAILQIGDTDWRQITQTDFFDWHYMPVSEIHTLVESPEEDEPANQYNYVLLTNQIQDNQAVFDYVNQCPAFHVIYLTKNILPEWLAILQARRAFYFDDFTPDRVVQRIETDLYFGQIGFATRFSEQQFVPSEKVTGHLSRGGRFLTQFSGDFGSQWQALGYLKVLAGDLSPNRENLVWLEHETQGNIEVALKFVFFRDDKIQQVQIVSGEQLHALTPIGGLSDYANYQVIVMAKGRGQVSFHALHQRRTRHGLGHLLPGGEWHLTSEGEEVLSYFNPGMRNKPLIVSFAGSRLFSDGFELMGVFDELETPYLLFTDSRTQGGVFEVGSKIFEQTVIDRIRQAMAELGITGDDVIFHGYSMGSYPAMYYAADIQPAAIVISKPIINLGSFSAKMDFPHHRNTDWTLDMRRHLTGRMSKEDTVVLDEKLWQHIKQIDWKNIDVSLFTMDLDEYDGESLPELLDFFREQHVHLTHFEEHGYHIEKISEMITFIKNRLYTLRDKRWSLQGDGGK